MADAAEYQEMKSLLKNWPEIASCATDDPCGAPRVFVAAIGMDGDDYDVDDFCSAVGIEDNDPDKYSTEWWDGFAEGALEAFNEINNKL